MMNPVILSRLFASHSGGWKYFARAHLSVAQMFFFYVLPMSIIPALMIYYAGVSYREDILPSLTLTGSQLEAIGVVFFIAELAMVFFAAWMVQLFADLVLRVLDTRQEMLRYPAEEPAPFQVEKGARKVSYQDAFSLAAVAPTPLWIGSLFLFVPSFVVDITIGALALVGAAAIIHYATPALLRIEDEGKGALVSYTLISVGMVAWAAMMYLTLFAWHIVTSGFIG